MRIDATVLALVSVLLGSAGCGNLSLITPAVRTDLTFRNADATAGAAVPSAPACPGNTTCIDATGLSASMSAMSVTVGTGAITAELQVLGTDGTDLVTADSPVDLFDLSAPGNIIGSFSCCNTPDYPDAADAAVSAARFVFVYYDVTFVDTTQGEQTVRFVNADVPALGYQQGDKLLKVGDEYRWCTTPGTCNQSVRPSSDLVRSDELLNYLEDDLPAGDNEAIIPFRATVEEGGLLPRAELLVNSWTLTVDFTLANQIVFLNAATGHVDLPDMVYNAEFNGAPWWTGLNINVSTTAAGIE